MTSLSNLQKALLAFEHEVHNYPSEIWLSTFKEFKEKFSVFVEEQTAKEQALRKLFERFPMPDLDKYFMQAYTGTPIFDADDWQIDFEKWKKKVFDEVFGKAEGNK